jgi:hypothetical protein
LEKCEHRRRRPQEKVGVVVAHANGEIIDESEQVVERWNEYFKSLMNVEGDRRMKLTSMGRGDITNRNGTDHNVIER